MRIADKKCPSRSHVAWNKGLKTPPEIRAKIGRKGELSSWFGKELSDETKAKISAANSGEKQGCYIDGLYRHYLAGTHQLMMFRCYHRNTKHYRNYGEKGVTVWEPWHNRKTFIFGVISLLGDRPEGMTLDRINPHGDYVPCNIRWATPKQQSNNWRRHAIDWNAQWGEH